MFDLVSWLLNLLSALIWYVATLWQVIVAALTLNPDVLQAVETNPQSRLLVLGVVFLAGVSTLMGQSVALFVNKIKPGRFVATLLTNGLIFVVSWSIWAASIWLVGDALTGLDVALGPVIRIVALSTAPLTLGFFVLIPYLGTLIGRVLAVWSLLITLSAVRYTFQLDFPSALLVVGLGWLLMWIVSNTIGRPVVAARNWIWQRIAGTPPDATAAEILVALATDSADEPTVKRGNV